MVIKKKAKKKDGAEKTIRQLRKTINDQEAKIAELENQLRWHKQHKSPGQLKATA